MTRVAFDDTTRVAFDDTTRVVFDGTTRVAFDDTTHTAFDDMTRVFVCVASHRARSIANTCRRRPHRTPPGRGLHRRGRSGAGFCATHRRLRLDPATRPERAFRARHQRRGR